jgi:hypothetical protein
MHVTSLDLPVPLQVPSTPRPDTGALFCQRLKGKMTGGMPIKIALHNALALTSMTVVSCGMR